MDKEGQSPDSAAVFDSQKIGEKATPEYFSNVKGGKKDNEKVRKRLSSKARKILVISLIAAALILVATTVMLVIVNITGKKIGQRTAAELPTTIEEIQDRTYKVLYRSENGGYKEALKYLNDLLMDMTDSGSDDNLIFATFVLRAEVAFDAGNGSQAGLNEALYLRELAETERQKYVIYTALARMYSRLNDIDTANMYRDIADTLDMEINREDGGTGVSEGEADE